MLPASTHALAGRSGVASVFAIDSTHAPYCGAPSTSTPSLAATRK